MTNPTTITFKHQGEIIEGLVLANKGICWQVELSDGTTTLVQKKHVISEDTASAELTDPNSIITDDPFADDEAPREGSLASMLTKIRASGKVATPKGKKAPKPPSPAATEPSNTVSLKQLCAECQVEPRIARRRLRKALGQVGTGSRWEWEAGSAELEAVRTAITGA